MMFDDELLNLSVLLVVLSSIKLRECHYVLGSHAALRVEPIRRPVELQKRNLPKQQRDAICTLHTNDYDIESCCVEHT